MRKCVTIAPPTAQAMGGLFKVKRFDVFRRYGAMAKKQHYMTEHERYKLEAYLQAGRGVFWIARRLP